MAKQPRNAPAPHLLGPEFSRTQFAGLNVPAGPNFPPPFFLNFSENIFDQSIKLLSLVSVASVQQQVYLLIILYSL